MIRVGIFFIELIILFLLSRRLNQSIFSLFYRFSHSEHIAVTLTTLLLFPGTVIHELSHLFTAEILGVRTGKLTLIPERISEHHIQAGSVMVAHTDPFRRTAIGLAPIFIGIISITFLSIQLTTLFPILVETIQQYGAAVFHPLEHQIVYIFLLLGYLLFAISNNMFSSKEDLQGVTPVLIFLGIVIGVTYAVGFRMHLTGTIVEVMETILKTVITNLGIVLGINIVLLGIMQIPLHFFRRRH